jgi:hypothetical protein
MRVESDIDLAQSAGVPLEVIHLARTLKTAIKEGKVGWMPQLREMFKAKQIAEVAGLDIALANMAGLPTEDDREFVLDKIKSIHGSVVTSLEIGKQL